MSEHRQRLLAEARQEEIIRAAVELAGEQGVDSVTTQDMADAVGTRRARFSAISPARA